MCRSYFENRTARFRVLNKHQVHSFVRFVFNNRICCPRIKSEHRLSCCTHTQVRYVILCVSNCSRTGRVTSLSP